MRVMEPESDIVVEGVPGLVSSPFVGMHCEIICSYATHDKCGRPILRPTDCLATDGQIGLLYN
jgi:hypothetical protein